MMRYGLLLTPEILTIPINKAAQNREDPTTEFRQARACFTLVEDRNELWLNKRLDELGRATSHVSLFGEFAVGIDPIRARDLGVLPVIYFYSGTDSAHDTVSHEILFTLRELRSLAIALARLEAKAGIPDRDTLDAAKLDAIGYVLAGDPIVRNRIVATNRCSARAAVDLLDTDRRPAWALVDWIDAILDLFQTADSRSSAESLAYYQEREWRVAPLFSAGVRCRRLRLDKVSGEKALPAWVPELRGELRSLDGEFFTEEVLNESAVLYGTHNRRFFEFVEEIVCPAEVAESVARLLDPSELRSMDSRGAGPVVFVRSTRG
ncbi:MAG: hypothetical protein OXQ89_20105 [Rhodospirillaceae bacterium]|nr:hypothetical protein [Rhodospirillaceae bacterium]